MSAHRILVVTEEAGALRADCACGIGIYARIGGFTELGDKVGRHFHFAAERGQAVIWPEVVVATNTVVWPEVVAP